MTSKEVECFQIARWRQRKQLLSELKDKLKPKVPLFNTAKQTAQGHIKLFYIALAIVTTPFFLIIWPIDLAMTLIRLPFQYVWSYYTPASAKAPGERNIRGIHHAFAPHMDLNPESYIACIDDWVQVLYGEQVAKKHKMTRYVDENLLHLSRFRSEHPRDPLLQHLRSSVAMAREKISLDLGCYKS